MPPNIRNVCPFNLLIIVPVMCNVAYFSFILVSSFNNVTFQASTQQQAEPSSVAAETPRISVISTEKVDKSQPQLENTTVTKKKKSPSPTSGLTPIEYTRNVSAQNGPAVATSQGTADPVVTKVLPVSSSAVGMSKQNLPQVSKLADPQKPLVQTPCST
jgi:cytoskeletal protein RodZ